MKEKPYRGTIFEGQILIKIPAMSADLALLIETLESLPAQQQAGWVAAFLDALTTSSQPEDAAWEAVLNAEASNPAYSTWAERIRAEIAAGPQTAICI